MSHPSESTQEKEKDEEEDLTKRRGGDTVQVVFVLRRNAKSAKTSLENASLLHPNFRMTPADPTTSIVTEAPNHHPLNLGECIAIPVVKDYENARGSGLSWYDVVVGIGIQWCPYSTAILGNRRPMMASTSLEEWNLNQTQAAVLQSIINLSTLSGKNSECISQPSPSPNCDAIVETIRGFDRTIVPTSCEVLGDDRTLVITPHAFAGDAFENFLCSNSPHRQEKKECFQELWNCLAASHGSARIARRGTVDPNSRIRESGYRLVWPITTGILHETGPGSHGWITVTEQKIKQSFDMTRVMFSRGNVSEKIRFGKLVAEGDKVLDLYAGIGYYTLPAVIHGKASRVVACEWNEHAIEALRYNIRDNQVEDRVAVVVGDCRSQAKEHGLVDMFDRVSLGLLPSSEGGWRTAVRALRSDAGGWLHIHGNVPDKELEAWALWLCRSLLSIVIEEKRPDSWIVVATHLERVKSFAPTVSHFVADIHVGPWQQEAVGSLSSRCGVMRGGLFIPCTIEAHPPSCALSANGVLNQAWMREE